ncbi:MAG: slipin family protein [Candidatus Woesearchaeota archaeon]
MFGWIMLFLVIFFFVILPGIRILYEYQVGIVFRFGKYHKTIKAGFNWIIPYVDTVEVVDLRIRTIDITPHEAMTKDNVPVKVNTVVYFKVIDAVKAVLKLRDYVYAVQQYTQAAIRDVIGNEELDVILAQRDRIASEIRKIVDNETDEWGVDIISIKIQEIELPETMKRAMAKQAEAERERRAMIITSEGELSAAKNLKQAADELSRNPITLQLRTLQTLRDISKDPAQKILVVLPQDLTSTVQTILKKK